MIAVAPIRAVGSTARIACAVVSLAACGDDPAPPVDGATATSPVAADPPQECVGPEGLTRDTVVATFDGHEVRWGDVDDRIVGDLRALDIQHAIARYELESKALDRVVVEQLLIEEAHRQNEPDVETLLRHQVDDRLTEPTQADIADAYPRMVRRLGNAPLAEAAPTIADELRSRAREDGFRDYVEGLKADRGLSILLPYPELPRIDIRVGADDPVRGALDAVVTIVEFSEYECAWCERVAPTLDRILADYDGSVRLVHKDYPLSGHSRAFAAAIAAHCAGEQGRFWELHHLLMTHQDQLDGSDLLAWAEQAGVERDAFVDCTESGRHDADIAADIDDARAAGVQATPAFFVNGLYMSGAQPYERFRSVIDRELAKGP